MQSYEPIRRITQRSAPLVVALLLSGCGSSDSVEDASSTVDSLPFAEDTNDTSELDAGGSLIDDDVEISDEELFEDDIDQAPDVTPETPLTETETAAIIAATPTSEDEGSGDDAAADTDVSVGASVEDPTHVGTVGVTAEHLMRELAIAYDGLAELLIEPERTDAGGTFSFSLTATDAGLGGGDTHRVDVEFSYVLDADEPAMIVGHRADSVVLTPYELAG